MSYLEFCCLISKYLDFFPDILLVTLWLSIGSVTCKECALVVVGWSVPWRQPDQVGSWCLCLPRPHWRCDFLRPLGECWTLSFSKCGFLFSPVSCFRFLEVPVSWRHNVIVSVFTATNGLKTLFQLSVFHELFMSSFIKHSLGKCRSEGRVLIPYRTKHIFII